MISKAWKPFQKGDVIDVVAPGFASRPHEVEAARDFLLSWGLVPRIPVDLLAPHFLHANDDQERARFLKAALAAPDSKAVWCLRGGYGSNRLLPSLAKMRRPSRMKLLIGISDVTSLHVFLNQEWRWPTLHGPLLDRLGQRKVSKRYEAELRRILFGQENEVQFRKLKPMNEAARRVRRLEGPVTGGNLVVLQSTLGTPWQLETRGKFLFIEDLGERGYRVDRILEHFRQAGLFRGCRGLLIGDFLGGEEPDSKKPLWPLVFRRWAQDLEIPVFQGVEAGHGVVQRPLPLGTAAVLRGGPTTATLTLSTGSQSK